MLRLWTVEDKARSASCAELESLAEVNLTGFSSHLTFEVLAIPFDKALAPFVADSWWRVIANVVAFEDFICDSSDAMVAILRDPMEYLTLLQFGELFTGWPASTITRRLAKIAPSKAIVGDVELARQFSKIRFRIPAN